MAEDDVGNVVSPCGQSLTVFLGGAGMAGVYNDEFIDVLQEASICNPIFGNYSGLGWTDGGVGGVEEIDMLGDALSVIFFNQMAMDRWHYCFDGTHWWRNPTRREDQWVRLNTSPAHMREALDGNYSLPAIGVAEPLPREEDQFNIIGYSWGAVVACLTARYHALQGHKVDNLVLIGAPVNSSLLEWVQSMPNIKNVIVENLTQYGDSLYAGMTDFEILVAVRDMMQTISNETGHFYYSGSGTDETITRKRQLVVRPISGGLQ